MSEKITYKPQLKYELPELNTVNNIPANATKQVEQLQRTYRTDSYIDRISLLHTELEKIIADIETKLINLYTPVTLRDIDGEDINGIAELPDGNKFLEEGLITFNLYKACENKPIYNRIVQAWDLYQSGINGNIWAELRTPAVNMLHLSSNIQYLITNTLRSKYTNDKEFYKVYGTTKSILDKSLEDLGNNNISILMRLYSNLETELNYRKDMIPILKKFSSGLSKFNKQARNITDLKQQEIAASQQSFGISAAMIEELTERGFKYKAKKLHKQLQAYRVNATQPKRTKTFTKISSNITNYLDKTTSSMYNILRAVPKEDVSHVGEVFVDGLESMIDDYQNAIKSLITEVEYNILNNTDVIPQVKQKHIARSLYHALPDVRIQVTNIKERGRTVVEETKAPAPVVEPSTPTQNETMIEETEVVSSISGWHTANVTLTAEAMFVAIGLSDYSEDELIMVWRNGVYLTRGTHYKTTGNNIESLEGLWLLPATFDIVVARKTL